MYQKRIENKLVDFKIEKDYLGCRLQYLDYCEYSIMPAVTFLQFIIDEMYNNGIEIESIVDAPYIGMDMGAASGSQTFYGDVSFDSYSTDGTPAASDSTSTSSFNFSYDSATPSGDVIIDNVLFNNVLFKNYNSPTGHSYVEPEDDEDDPDDEINNRFDILDL